MMVTAEWLFTNHLNHVAKVAFLTSQSNMPKALGKESIKRDEEIESMALYRPPLDGTPHTLSTTSSTERTAFAISSNAEAKEDTAQALTRYQHYLELFDYVMACLTEKEKWIVNQFFIQGNSLSSMVVLPESPFFGYAKTSLWRIKERLIQKANGYLSAL